ncbi:MAG: glycoside hydrolase family 3 N-terminal domain-containing protein [Acidobacteriaceae bacterium]
MTLKEKIGQLVQVSAGVPSGPGSGSQDYETLIAQGDIGSMLNEGADHTVFDPQRTNAFQRIAAEKSRLHIPLLFGLDVIHGYRTIFPVPLGLASSFDPALIQATARMAAQEASNDGIRWTFSPMVDIAQDARWGRIVEGAGESPWLGSAIARAYVRGYQGTSLSNPDSIAACVKHFAGYGAVTAGREYNAANIPDIILRQVYLPPYQAAVDAGAATVMAALSSLNSVPETADPYMLTEILRNEWGFNGLVVSDWGAIPELVNHGVALNDATAARKALAAGVDMDMVGNSYHSQLLSLVRSGAIPASVIDEAVKRVLRVKFALGLFQHPYAPAKPYTATADKRALARTAADESLVLLQNNNDVLPIRSNVKTIALIGPMANSEAQMLGSWSAGNPSDVVTLGTSLEMRMQARGGRVLYAEGTQILTSSKAGFAAAVQAAQQSDLVILALGEDAENMISEASSRAHLDLPGNQEQLLEAVAGVGKPVVLLVFSGRPLVLNSAAAHVAAIVEAWFPGIEAGPALTDVLFGDVNFSAKLPVSFPRAVGQEPLYLGQLPTGRPAPELDLHYPPRNDPERFYSRYIDVPNSPLFPFGYGLSYTRFDFSRVALNTNAVRVSALMKAPGEGIAGDPVEATVTVRNSGPVAGTEVVQLYIRIRGASVEEPVRALKGFERVSLQPGESKAIHFSLGFNELSFVNARSEWVVEPADYTVYIGGSSQAADSADFQITQ